MANIREVTLFRRVADKGATAIAKAMRTPEGRQALAIVADPNSPDVARQSALERIYEILATERLADPAGSEAAAVLKKEEETVGSPFPRVGGGHRSRPSPPEGSPSTTLSGGGPTGCSHLHHDESRS